MIAYGQEPDALDPFREPDADWIAASPRPGLSLGLLIWAALVALVRWWLS